MIAHTAGARAGQRLEVAPHWIGRAIVLLVGPVALILSGCQIGDQFGWIEVDSREWYTSFAVTMDIRTGGSRYANVRYEYNPGDGWVTGFERTLRFAASEDGVLEFQAEPGYSDDPLVIADAQQWDHRITATALVRTALGRPLTPGATVEHYFNIDTIAPSAGADLTINLDPDGPPDYTAFIDHTEFASPAGSSVRVKYVRDWEEFREWSPSRDSPGQIDVWYGFSAPHSETWKFIVVDDAGNRSGIRRVTFSY